MKEEVLTLINHVEAKVLESVHQFATSIPDLPGLTFVTFFDAIGYFAKITPTKIALIDAQSDRAVSYAELASNINRISETLAGNGIGPGANVVTVMPRSSELVETVLSVSRVGGGCVAYISARDLKAALSVSRETLKPKFFIYSPGFADPKALAEPGESWLSFEELVESNIKIPVIYIPQGETILYLNESSGSTSRPKLVSATHEKVIRNTEACVQTFHITSKDIHLCTFTSHIHEIFARALLTGGTAIIVQESVAENPIAYLEAMVKQKVTCLMSNTPCYMAFVNLSRYRKKNFSIRIAESGGTPTPESLGHHLNEKFGAKLMPVWGSTETTGVAIAPPRGEKRPFGSVGKVIPGYRLTIVNEDNCPLPPGSTGELVISGNGVASHYLGGDTNGQLGGLSCRTGDRAMIDEDGWVFIKGRIRNEFKVLGVLCSTEQIEAAVSLGDAVKEVAILPIPHPFFGYSVAALIVPEKMDERLLNRKTESRIIREIIEATEPNLEHPFLELPTRIKWVDELPRTPAGKINRLMLPSAFEEKPESTKVRLSKFKQLKLSIAARKEVRIATHKGKSLIKLFLRNPIGMIRLVRTLLRGEKNK